MPQVVDAPRAVGVIVAEARAACVSTINMNERGDGHVSYTVLALAGARAPPPPQ